MTRAWPPGDALVVAPTLGAKFSSTGPFELRVRAGVVTLFFDVTATSAAVAFDALCSVPAGLGLGSGRIQSLSAYRTDGVTLTTFRISDSTLQTLAAVASGTRLLGSATWVTA